MALALLDVIGHAPLTETLRYQTMGLPDPFPPELAAVSEKNRVLGDRAQYTRIGGQRGVSKLGQYGNPAPTRRPLADIGRQPVRMLFFGLEEIQIPVDVMQQLQAFEQYRQDEGMDWLRHQAEMQALRMVNTRLVARASMLRHGIIYFDSSRNILADSSGADSNLTVDAGVPATHKSQINSIIDVSWLNAAANIPSHIRNIKQYSAQETGMEPDTAMYGINVPTNMVNNDNVLDFLARNSEYNMDYLRTGEIPNGLFGIKRWIPVWVAFFENEAGTNVEIWDDDLVVFMPPIDQPDKMRWWTVYEGSWPVPRSLQPTSSPEAALGNFDHEYGMFSFAAMPANIPYPGFNVYYGDVNLPIIRNEKATFHADTVF